MSYEMYTPAGNRACESMVKSARKKILGKTRLTVEAIQKIYDDGLEKVNNKHSEVYDTEPRWHIARKLSEALKEAGYMYRFNAWGDVEED